MLRNFLILALTIIIGASITYGLDYTNRPVLNQVKSDNTKNSGNGSQSEIKVPDFSFTALDGQIHEIKTLRGKTIVLNFWASWCTPCVKEFPLFLKLALDFPNDVVFIGLSSDHDPKAMNRFLDKMRKSNQTAMDADNVFIALDESSKITRGLFQTLRLPETIIIDNQGIMREKLIGADWDYEYLRQLVEGL